MQLTSRVPVSPHERQRKRYVLLPVVLLSLASATFSVHAAQGFNQGRSSRLMDYSAGKVRQHLSMTPQCFVAGRRISAQVTLTHAGPDARVEFIWAPTTGISLGPGYGPGVYRSGFNGVVRFSAVPPSKYGNGTIGNWVLAAEWPKAAHAFVRVYFKIVAHKSEC
jgi:hypothetical protein